MLLELSYLSKLSHPRLVRYLNSGLLSETLPGPSGESEALHYIAYVRTSSASPCALYTRRACLMCTASGDLSHKCSRCVKLQYIALKRLRVGAVHDQLKKREGAYAVSGVSRGGVSA